MTSKSRFQEQDDQAAEQGRYPCKAIVCPRVVAGLRCLRDADCLCTRHHQLLDHARIWWKPASQQHEMTCEPYQAYSEGLDALFGDLHALGLNATVSTKSPWYPGSTLMIEVRRAPVRNSRRA